MTARLAVGIGATGKHRAPKIFRRLGHFGLRDLALKLVGRHAVSRGGQISVLSGAMDTANEASQLIDENLPVAAAIDHLDAVTEIGAEFHDQPCTGCGYPAKLT